MRIAVLCMAMALALGCGKSDPGEAKAQEKRSFVGDGYSIDPPKGWKHEPVAMSGLSGDSFLADLASGANFRSNLVVVKEPLPANMTSKAYADQAVPMIESSLQSYKNKGRTDVKLGDLDAVRISVEHKMGQFELALVQYMVVSNKAAYALGCTTLTKDAEKDMPGCEAAIKTFLPN